jgi:Tetratricopeptide repeat
MNPATPQPSAADNWQQKAQSRWNLGDKQGAIDEVIAAINQGAQQGELPRSPCLHLAYYLFQLGDFAAGEQVLNQLLQKDPADLEVLENRAIMQIRKGDIVAAARDFQAVVAQNPNSVNAWDGLTNALYRLGKWPEAIQAGEQALQRKDQQCPPPTSQLSTGPAMSTQAWDAQNQGQDIISFSLWGNNPVYLRGAVSNLLEAPIVYPGWQCRFYVDETVPLDFVVFVQEAGGQVVIENPNQSLRAKLCWRFQVANDPTVRRFLVRDADAVINSREARAVAEWLASDRWFHIMRDYWTHTDLILAGMWGGRSGLLPLLMPLIEQYKPGRLETANIDQWFLRDCVWPLIRDRALIHDRNFRAGNSCPWPDSDPPGNFHVGQNEAVAHPALQTERLGQLLGEYTWLQ